jgi:hypothetical protein
MQKQNCARIQCADYRKRVLSPIKITYVQEDFPHQGIRGTAGKEHFLNFLLIIIGKLNSHSRGSNAFNPLLTDTPTLKRSLPGKGIRHHRSAQGRFGVTAM